MMPCTAALQHSSKDWVLSIPSVIADHLENEAETATFLPLLGEEELFLQKCNERNHKSSVKFI